MFKLGERTKNLVLHPEVISKNHLRIINRALRPNLYYNTVKYITILTDYITILSNIL